MPEQKAEKVMAAYVSNKSEGRVKLTKFVKTDGLETPPYYQMRFYSEIEFSEDCWTMDGLTLRDHPFSTVKYSRENPGKPLARKGQTRTVTGVAMFEVTERNVNVVQVEAESDPMTLKRDAVPSPAQSVTTTPDTDRQPAGSQTQICLNQLKGIFFALGLFSTDNGDRFPFNVKGSEGGTVDWVSSDQLGFDKNPAKHFGVLSNELSTPKILVCASDRRRRVAGRWEDLQNSNIPEKIRTRPSSSGSNTNEVVVVCPTHHLLLMCDGRVRPEKAASSTIEADPQKK